MISIHIVFWMFVLIFAVIGALRGWARELLVTFALVISIFLLSIIHTFAPGLEKSIAKDAAANLFWFKFAVTVVLVVGGYQSVSIPRISASPRLVRGNLQDTLLGLFIGLVNGFLIVGTIWFYLHDAKYPLDIINAPIAGTTAGDAALKMIPYLAPSWLTSPSVYFAAALAFGLMIVLFI
jgi:uncharacterized membrane protein required for colicin V production